MNSVLNRLRNYLQNISQMTKKILLFILIRLFVKRYVKGFFTSLDMSTFKFDGVTVKFPFPPYDIQKEYMRKVIMAIKNNENAMLESPTGTGKVSYNIVFLLYRLCRYFAHLLQQSIFALSIVLYMC